MHYTLKAAMDGMLEHGKRNFAQQGSLYTCDKVDATGIMGMSATPLFDPQSYMELEGRFSGRQQGIHHRRQRGGGVSRKASCARP